MNTRKTRMVALVLAVGLSGTAQAELQGRDLNGSIDSFEAYYDTDLNITWLADANYAKTSGYSETPGHNYTGSLSWVDANTWAANLSFTDGANVYDNWRLPTVTDTGTPGCNLAFTGTDCGYNVDTATSEMAHLFYDELGNKATYNTAGVGGQAGVGLTNTGPFTNLQDATYWSGTEYSSQTAGYAWWFSFGDGYQYRTPMLNTLYVLVVSPGDVGAVPEADTWAMLLAGLGLMGVATRRRKLAKD